MKNVRRVLVAILPLVMIAAAPVPATAPSGPIKEVAGVTVNEKARGAATAVKPIVLKSEKEAAEYFAEAELAKLVKAVDFKTQMVLVFAWSGSGQDKMEYSIAESYPEQIRFTVKRGMTRDLRPHVAIFVLRSNVTWSAG